MEDIEINALMNDALVRGKIIAKMGERLLSSAHIALRLGRSKST